MRRICSFLLLIIIVSALILTGCSTPANTTSATTPATMAPAATTQTAEKNGTLRIGGINPLSGVGAPWGDPISKMTQIYVDLLNKDGGVLIGNTRYKLELYEEDDKMLPEEASKAVTKLFDVDKVDVLLGDWSPSIISLAGDAAYERNKVYISQLTYYPGVEVLGKDRPTSFGLLYNCVDAWDHFFPDLVKGGVLNSKVIATLWADGIPMTYESNRFKEMASQWEQDYGFKQVSSQTFPFDTTDLTPYLLKINSLPEKVDTIVGDMAPFHMASLVKQGYAINPNWNYVIPAYLTDIKQFCDLVGYDAAQHCYTNVASPFNWSGNQPSEYKDMANRIRAEWQARYGQDLSYGSGFVNQPDELAVYLEAAKQAGTIETSAVVRALETSQLKHFYGTVGPAVGTKTFGMARFLDWGVQGMQMGKIEGYQMVPVVTIKLETLP